MRIYSTAILLAACTHFTTAFLPASQSQYTPRLFGTSLNAIGVLARKAKEAEIKRYRDAGIPPEVQSKLDEMSFTAEPSTEPTYMQQQLTKRRGTITVIAEYKRRLDKGGFITEILNPEVLSPSFREFGATAIAVMADERMGGCTYDDIAKMKKEQESARGEVPGPCFVISSDLIVDEVQIARSAVSGADAVMLSVGILGEEKTQKLIAAARSIGLDCIVNVVTRDEANQAIRAGGRILCVTGVDDADEKIAAVTDLEIPEGVKICTIGAILARDNKQMEEVEEAWLLRDKGFNSVWVSDCLYKSGADATEHPGAIIRSMKAKSSVKYASAKAMSGRGEGAREYLGDLLM